MIRKVVVEEVSKAINKSNLNNDKDKTILIEDNSPAQPAIKKQRTANRMSKLLATVNRKES